MATTVVQNCALHMCNSATMSSDLSWNDYRIFLALSRQRSLGQAARALGVNLSTVRRRLASLEEHLGTRLIERRREGVILTRTGERLLPRALVLEAAAAQIEREAADMHPRRAETCRRAADRIFNRPFSTLRSESRRATASGTGLPACARGLRLRRAPSGWPCGRRVTLSTHDPPSRMQASRSFLLAT